MNTLTSNRLKRRVLALAFAAAVAAVLFFGPHRSWAASDAEVRQRIQETLQERHPTDTPEWWRSLGANAPRIIIAMYGETDSTHRRLRLLGGLGAFDTPEAAEFLRKQAESASESVVRTTAIRSLGASQGARELGTVSKFLQHEDPQTRLAAAQTLGSFDDPRAREALERYRREEKVPWVLQRLKGEMPKPRGVLTPVGSSDDRLSPDFAGEWRGYLLRPRKPGEAGLNSHEAALRLLPEGQTVSGELRVTGAGGTTEKSRLFRIERGEGKGLRLTGRFAEVVAQPAFSGRTGRGRPSPAPLEVIAFEAELSQEAGNYLILARNRASGAVLVLRRSPQP